MNPNDVLKSALAQRTGFGYNLAKSLGGISSQGLTGTGAGIANFASAFGRAFNAPVDDAVSRAEQAVKMNFLERELAVKENKVIADQGNRDWERDFKERDLDARMAQSQNESQYRIEALRNQALSPYERTLQVKEAEKNVARDKGLQASQEMLPIVEEAIRRLEMGLDAGAYGIGPLEGRATKYGANPHPDAAANYANVENAYAQMNAFLRQKLASTGLTGSELNSALEANAYRYTIAPTDEPKIIRQKLANFRKDYMQAQQSAQTQQPAQRNTGGLRY